MKIKLLFLFISSLCLNFVSAQNCDPVCEIWCEHTQECINVCSECDKVVIADNCADATTPSYAELDGFKINSCVFSPDGPGGLPQFCGPGTIIHNNFWIGFTPSLSGLLHLNIEIISCEAANPSCTGVQAAICRALCSNPGNVFSGFEYETLDCVNCVDQTFDLITMNAIAGLPHYIMIDGCCGDLCEMIINVIDTGLLDPEIITNANDDLELKIQGGLPPYNVEWDNGEIGLILENPIPNTSYTASIKDARNDTRCITSELTIPNSIEENQYNINIEYFPNPVSSVLNLKVESNDSWSYKILNREGKLMQKGISDIRRSQIDVSRLVSGMYFIYFEVEDVIRMEKFVKM